MRKSAVTASLLTLTLALSGCVVSKKEYLLKSEEADRCSASLTARTQENRELTQELSSAQADLKETGSSLQGCRSELAAAGLEITDLQGRLATQTALAEELRQQVDKLGQLLESKEVSQSAIIKETMEINRKLRDDNAGLREELATQRAALGTAEQDRKETEARLAACLEREAALQGELEELNRRREEELAGLKGAYDELVGSLKSEIEAGEVQIRRMKDRLSVNLVDKILFDSGTDRIKSSGLQVLKKVAVELGKIGDKRVQIEGHTDNVPIGGTLKERFPTNWELSVSRAVSVVRYLQEVGMKPELLSAAGYGEYQPAADNGTAAGRSLNRRIEIVLLPLYEPSSQAQESSGAEKE